MEMEYCILWIAERKELKPMLVLAVYDVSEKRNKKVFRIFKQFLCAIQESVFQGEITEKQFRELKEKLSLEIKDEDYIIFYLLDRLPFGTTEVLGLPKERMGILL